MIILRGPLGILYNDSTEDVGIGCSKTFRSVLSSTVVMRFSLPAVLALATSVSSVLAAPLKRATPTLYLVGDSTMANHAASEGIQGSVTIMNIRNVALSEAQSFNS